MSILLAVVACLAQDPPAKEANPMVILETSFGNVVVELYPDKAPLTVKNFLSYVEKKHYDGTLFHRVMADFMVQTGGFDGRYQEKPTDAPIRNEAKNGLKNRRGTLAMARTPEVDSATSQFFINVADNDFLDHGVRDFGYCVFGKVVEGLDVVDKIGKVKTTTRDTFEDVPVTPVLLRTARVKKDEKKR